VRELPGLAGVATRAITAALGMSQGYAARVRKGEVVPHPGIGKRFPRLTNRTARTSCPLTNDDLTGFVAASGYGWRMMSISPGLSD